MSQRRPSSSTPSAAPVRCAIYTRKSTEEGLEQAFNSLDAQREAAEAYLNSQAHEGWVLVPTAYDDGGYTGGNLDRPALQRLQADIEAGRIDCVLVYKVDRLSRSLLDFARLMALFERHGVSFVSVTQLINSANSMGRLMLNVLLSFAQFERELVSERTKDKIALARRKGKWAGGQPLLGYDLDPQNRRLQVNAREAAQVRAIFALYAEHQALLPVVQELEKRGWTTKSWTTKKGVVRGGKPIGKTRLHQLLTNVAYLGKVRHKEALYAGEQEALVEEALWRQVQTLLARNGRSGGALVRDKFGSILKGLLYCKRCGCAMSPSVSIRNKTKHYRYYRCLKHLQHGAARCPKGSAPAGELERFVIDQIRAVGQDPALAQEVLAAARRQGDERRAELEREQRGLEKDLCRWHAELSAATQNSAEHQGLLADLQERLRLGEVRSRDVREELGRLDQEQAQAADLLAAFRAFDPVWAALTANEQARVLGLLLERIDYDGAGGQVTLAFRANGFAALDAHDASPQRRSA